MDQDESLVKGGCGHSADDIESSAAVCGICFGAMVLMVISIAIVRFFA